MLVAALALLLTGVAFASPARADVGSIGPVSKGAGTNPSGEKPESKLWFNDGLWWGVLWNSTTADFEIFKLDPGTGTWSTTGTLVDPRAGTHQDALWDGTHLYVASHVFTTSPAVGAADASRLYRFSYNASTKTYTLDAGFPATINGLNLETLVIDKDTTGTLWATWVFQGKVWVAHTTSGDTTWSSPIQIPGVGTGNLTSDDISSIIAFSDAGGPKVGVMWSNQNDDTMYFAYHSDGAGEAAWTVEAAYGAPGTNLADDHINLKQAGGAVYAAVKTSKTGSNPLSVLLVRSASGIWSSSTVSLASDDPTRPILLLDPADDTLYYFQTGHANTGSTAFDAIFEKVTSMSSPSFGPGLGTVVIDDTDGSEAINNATSTKQNISPATGLEVLASSGAHYWHAFAPISPATPTPPTNTSPPSISGQPLVGQTLTADPGTWSGTQPITYHYEWHRCNPGCTTVGGDAPSYTLASADLGAMIEVKVTAQNGVQPDGTATSSHVGPVTNPPAELTFTPVADAYVRDSSPNTNYGTALDLRVRSSGPQILSFLKFEVTGLSGTVTSAKLRLFVTDASPDGGHAYSVSNNWTETGITFNNAPSISGTALADAGAVSVGTWIELDVTSAVTGNGTYSFGLRSLSTNRVDYSSKEGANPPQLVVATSSGSDTTPPTVTQTSPASGATGVALSTNVTATFSEDVQGVGASTFTLTPQGGSPVAATVTYNASTHVATLDPSSDLAPNTVYTAALTGGSSGIRDLAGNSLSPNPTTFSFTTGSGAAGAIALAGSAISAGITTGETLTLPSWTPSANDLILVEVATRDETRPVSLSGNGLTWTELANLDNVQGQGGVSVWWAQGPAPTPGQITITLTGNTKPAVAVAQRFRGVSTTTPIEAFVTNAGPAVDNRDMLQAVTTGTAGAWAVGLSWHRGALLTVPGGQSAIAINQVAGSSGDITRASMWYQGPVSPAGNVQLGAPNDLSTANDWALVVLSLRPA